MAQVTVIKAVEGNSNIVIRVNMLSDGSGELVNFPILSAADLNPARSPTQPSFNIRQAWYGMVWYDVTLYCGTLQPVMVWTFARDCDSHIDFRSFGGIIDQNIYTVPPNADNGILSISTNNFAPANSQGVLILDIQKMNGVCA